MNNLQLESILSMLSDALVECNHEELKDVKDKINVIFEEAKSKLFKPKFLEYFYNKPDIEKCSNREKFITLKLSEERRIRDPRTLKKGDIIYVVTIRTKYTIDKIEDVIFIKECMYLSDKYKYKYEFKNGKSVETELKQSEYKDDDSDFSFDVKNVDDDEGQDCYYVDSESLNIFSSYRSDLGFMEGRLYIYK